MIHLRVGIGEQLDELIRRHGPTLLCRPVLLQVPDLEDDFAGLVGCACQHGLRLARLGKWQD